MLGQRLDLPVEEPDVPGESLHHMAVGLEREPEPLDGVEVVEGGGLERLDDLAHQVLRDQVKDVLLRRDIRVKRGEVERTGAGDVADGGLVVATL